MVREDEFTKIFSILNAEEIDYSKAAKLLGKDALPHLDNLVKTAEPGVASKAAYLSSLIDPKQSVGILKAAAQSNYPNLRVAAAFASRNLSAGIANEIFDLLKSDKDVGVLKAIKRIQRSLQEKESRPNKSSD